MKNIPLADAVRREFIRHQAEADEVCRALDMPAAPPPLDGETLPHYRQRVLKPLKKYSEAWRNADLPGNETVLDVAEKQILAAARREAVAPSSVPPGELVERVTVDSTGRRISRFYGDPAVTWGPFQIPPKLVIGFGGAGK